MNANHLSAFGASPPFLFVPDEMPYAEHLDVLQIVSHTHAILGSIPLVQVFQSRAGKTVATEAIFRLTFCYLLTVLNSAGHAGFRFETIVSSATWAYILISYKSVAEAAVHSAGSYQSREKCVCLFHSNFHPVGILAKLP